MRLNENIGLAKVSKEDQGVVNPTYASAIRDIEKAEKKKEETTKVQDTPKHEEKPKNPKMVKGAKKMHLDESLFEDVTENNITAMTKEDVLQNAETIFNQLQDVNNILISSWRPFDTLEAFGYAHEIRKGNDNHSGEEILRWRNYGSSAEENTLEKFRWVIEEIFDKDKYFVVLPIKEFYAKQEKFYDQERVDRQKQLEEDSIPRNARKITATPKVGGPSLKLIKDSNGWSDDTRYYDNSFLRNNHNITVDEIDPNYKPKRTKRVVVLQGHYGAGWDDLIEYEPGDPDIKSDFKSYEENEPNVAHRIIYRRIPILTEITDRQLQKERDDLRANGHGFVNGRYQKGTPEQQRRDRELDCISMINSLLAYNYAYNRNAKEILDHESADSHSYLKQYIDELGADRVLELIQGQIDSIERVDMGTHTDSEGGSYNSIRWKNESLLQDLQADHEHIRKVYGQEVYDALDEYVALGNDLGKTMYSEKEWDRFVRWAKQNKGLTIKKPNNDFIKDLKEGRKPSSPYSHFKNYQKGFNDRTLRGRFNPNFDDEAKRLGKIENRAYKDEVKDIKSQVGNDSIALHKLASERARQHYQAGRDSFDRKWKDGQEVSHDDIVKHGGRELAAQHLKWSADSYNKAHKITEDKDRYEATFWDYYDYEMKEFTKTFDNFADAKKYSMEILKNNAIPFFRLYKNDTQIKLSNGKETPYEDSRK